jgi:hypothetical protein
LHLQQLQTVHNRRPICFGFAHVIWCPRQDLHPHATGMSRHGLNVVCLLDSTTGALVKLSGLEPDRICLKGRAREPLCIQLPIGERAETRIP